MDNDFPLMLYGFPATGREPAQLEDGSYDTLTVKDADERAAAISEGWFAHWPDAKAAHAGAAKVAAETAAAAANNAPPTRAELEAKAATLGIAFSPAIGDKKLAERIDDALRA